MFGTIRTGPSLAFNYGPSISQTLIQMESRRPTGLAYGVLRG
jgi:hypothetical protein